MRLVVCRAFYSSNKGRRAVRFTESFTERGANGVDESPLGWPRLTCITNTARHPTLIYMHDPNGLIMVERRSVEAVLEIETGKERRGRLRKVNKPKRRLNVVTVKAIIHPEGERQVRAKPYMKNVFRSS